MGIEPTSLAWEARVMAIIRRPQRQRLYWVFGGLGRGVVLGCWHRNWHGSLVERWHRRDSPTSTTKEHRLVMSNRR